jgi:DUF1009 family protein
MAAGAPLGILAGGGVLPAEVARAAIAAGRPVTIFAIEGEAGPDVEAFAPVWIRRGQLGRLFRGARERGIGDLVVIGGIRQRRLPRLSECDLAGIWHVIRHLRLLSLGDDGVLRRVAGLLEAGGLRLVAAGEAAPALLAGEGLIAGPEPSPRHEFDMEAGRAAARALGRRDVGQGVVVRHGQILAEEDAAGTDAMLERLGERAAGAILVKCLKPQQDLRLDMPAIGPETVLRGARAGLAGIAIEAGGALVADRAGTMRLAIEKNLFIYGLERASGEIR